jgi:hypothetical protein
VPGRPRLPCRRAKLRRPARAMRFSRRPPGTRRDSALKPRNGRFVSHPVARGRAAVVTSELNA